MLPENATDLACRGEALLDISVIIPTHNRANLIGQAVRSAMALDYRSERYEIIVVDNASTDATRRVVESLQSNSNGCRLRYVPEGQLGLHHARHAGARAAKGEILIFTDDDATFDSGWLQAYASAFGEHPEMVAAGGPIRPVWETPPPEWILEFIGNAKDFGILSLMEPYKEFQLGSNVHFFGVNMAIRRDVLFDVGGFNPDAFGDTWLGDGETGLVRKLCNLEMLIGYVPEALVYHHIPPQRMTVEYFCWWKANEGACDTYARFHHGIPHRRNLCLQAASIGIKNSKCWLGALLLRGRTDGRALDVQLRAARTQAQLRYILRLIFNRDLRKLVLKENWLGKRPRVKEHSSEKVKPRLQRVDV